MEERGSIAIKVRMAFFYFFVVRILMNFIYSLSCQLLVEYDL